jgi:isoquinoline 1-oxidoreductase beta subunit
LPRRLLLAGTAGLLVPVGGSPSRAQSTGTADQEITDWIVIAPDGEITLGLSQPEVGQGSYTALPQILADELDADWQRVNPSRASLRDRLRGLPRDHPHHLGKSRSGL